MTDIEITDAQRARTWELAPTLRAVRAGEVWMEVDGTSVETFAEVFGLSDPIAEVTEQMKLAESAGLVVAVPLQHGGGFRWDLTDAGSAALAELDGSMQ